MSCLLPAALDRLTKRGRAPSTLYADGGYPTGEQLLSCRAQGTELVAPVHRACISTDSMSRADFTFDDAGLVVACPEGHCPTRISERASSDAPDRRRSLHVFFDAVHCNGCTRRVACPVRTPNHARAREYRLDIAANLVARDQRWAEQHTEPWRADYRIRAGVEGTMSELKRAHGLGRLRVRRLPRVRIQVALKTTACNIKRWWKAARPPAKSPLGGFFLLTALLAALRTALLTAPWAAHTSVLQPCQQHS